MFLFCVFTYLFLILRNDKTFSLPLRTVRSTRSLVDVKLESTVTRSPLVIVSVRKSLKEKEPGVMQETWIQGPITQAM